MPLWLIALLATAATVGVAKVVSKVTSTPAPGSTNKCLQPSGTPPSNPIFAQSGKSIDWNKLQAALGVMRDQGYSETDALLNGVAAVAINVPVYGWYVAAAALIAKKIVDWVGASSDANSDAQKARVVAGSQALVALGFLPAMPWKGSTLRAIADHLDFQTGTIATREPYVRWLIERGGSLFQKWGGLNDPLTLATKFLVDTTPDQDGVILNTLSTAPAIDVRDGEADVFENHPRLRLAAMCVALEFNVWPCVADVTAAALAANDAYKQVFAWKPGVAIAAPDTPLDDWDLQFPDENAALARYGGQASFGSYYAYAAGMHAAISKALSLAGQPVIAPLTAESVAHVPGDGWAPPAPKLSFAIGARAVLPRSASK